MPDRDVMCGCGGDWLSDSAWQLYVLCGTFLVSMNC